MISDWVPLKYLAQLNPETLADSTDPALSFGYIDIGATGRGELRDKPRRVAFGDAPSRARRVLRPGDSILSTVRTYLRAAWTVPNGMAQLVASTGFLCLRPRAGVDARYLGWLVQSDVVIDEVVARSVGVSYPAISPEEVGRIEGPCPAEPRQRSIADFLDRETARIDALIAAKRQTIGLLNERRRALRDAAFTSKRPWRLKRLLAAPMAYGVLVPEFVEPGAGVPMIRTYNLTATGSVSHDDVAEIPADLASEYRRTTLREGDVILSVVGSMGRSAVVTKFEDGFNLNRPLARLRLRPEVPPRLIWHWTQTTRFRDMALLATGGGTAQPTLNLSDLAEFEVGLPDEIQRWPTVLDDLEESCGRLNLTEVLVMKQIRLLQERRQALITDAVQGELGIGRG